MSALAKVALIACVACAVAVSAIRPTTGRSLIEKTRIVNEKVESIAETVATTKAIAEAGVEFNAGEHWMVVDEAFTHWFDRLSPQPAKPRLWGLAAGQIAAYFGDLYADATNPISNGFQTQCPLMTAASAAHLTADQWAKGSAAFRNSYAMLDAEMTTNKGAEAAALKAVIVKEITAIHAEQNAGTKQASTVAYQKVGDMHSTMQQDVVTQGRDASVVDRWWFSDIGHSVINSGRLLNLAKNNVDHFAPCNQIAYAVGHRMALEAAANNDLELAFKYELGSFHFLSDSFSSGHIRVPRGLANKVCGAVGALATAAMHAEDNFFGLFVVNNNGDKWTAFGDTRLLDADSARNKFFAIRAMTKSLNELWTAYTTKNAQPAAYTAIDDLPHVDPDQKTAPNHPPLLRGRPDGVMEFRNHDSGATYSAMDSLITCPKSIALHLRIQSSVKARVLETGGTVKPAR